MTAAQTALARRTLLEAALDQVSGSSCPVCDLDWDSEKALRGHLAVKLTASQNAGDVQARITNMSGRLGVQLEQLQRKVITAADTAGKLLNGSAHPEVLRNWAEEIAQTRRHVADDPTTAVEHALGTGDAGTALSSSNSQTTESAASLAAAAEALPDQTDVQAASTWLVRAEERWRQLARATATQRAAAEHARVADLLYSQYCTAMDAALDALYRSIEKKFSAYYQQINSGDEDTFRAELAPTAGKLDLSVGFYDLGLFPPGAYHSEGHQDGMGLALYLALLEHMLGKELSFVVLDDVITSIDIAHRRKICDLLLNQFPGVQFVITTHEKTWAKTIEQLKVVKRENVVEFQSWSVQTGPIRAEKGDVITEIGKELDKGSVSTAAPMLRQLLENRMRTHAHDLGAQPAFREDGRYELAPLLAAVGTRYTRLLDKAKKSARRFEDDEQATKVEWLEAVWQRARNGYGVEDWAINAMTHYNPAYDVTATEFAATVMAARELLAIFECDKCGYPLLADQETLRCRCNKFNLNLLDR